MKNLRIACFALSLIYWLYIFGIVIFSKDIIDLNDYGTSLTIITITTVVITVILARKLNRSGFGWGAFSLFLPWLSGFIIAFLGEREYKSIFDYYGNSSTYLVDKSCSSCGRSVSLSSAAGQRCPHCGAYWSSERESKRIQ